MKKRSKFSKDNKAKLNAAFKALRKLGYIARQNYMCCSSCAGAQIASDMVKMSIADRAKVKGCVFYHKQDTDSMNKYGELMLRFGPVEVEGIGCIGQNSTAVGRKVVEVLDDVGLNADWNEDPNKCIEVKNA